MKEKKIPPRNWDKAKNISNNNKKKYLQDTRYFLYYWLFKKKSDLKKNTYKTNQKIHMFLKNKS